MRLSGWPGRQLRELGRWRAIVGLALTLGLPLIACLWLRPALQSVGLAASAAVLAALSFADRGGRLALGRPLPRGISWLVPGWGVGAAVCADLLSRDRTVFVLGGLARYLLGVGELMFGYMFLAVGILLIARAFWRTPPRGGANPR